MVDNGSFVSRAVSALVSAGLVDATLRDEAQRVVMAAVDEPRKRSSRALVVEVTGYIGGALVVASIGLFLAQYWYALSGAVQVTALGGVTAVLVASGILVSHLGAGDDQWEVRHQHVRRRLASTLLSAGAIAAGVTLARLVALGGDERSANETWPIVVGTLTTLAIAAAAYVRVHSVVGQLTMMLATLMLVTSAWSLLDPHQTATWLPGVAFVLVGMLWVGGAEGGWFREHVPARAIGTGLSVFGSQFAILSGDHPTPFYVLMLLVSAAAFSMYVRTVAWPYLAGGVLGVTLLVPQAVIDWTGGALGPSGAVLAAGVTLLGASLVGLRVRRSAAEREPSDDHPGSRLASRLGGRRTAR